MDIQVCLRKSSLFEINQHDCKYTVPKTKKTWKKESFGHLKTRLSTIKTSENLGLGGPMLLEWSGSGSQRSYQWPVGVCRLSVSKRRKWEYIRHPQGSPTQGSFLEQPSIPTANTMYIICSYNIQEKHVDINLRKTKHIIAFPHIQPSH